MGYHTKETLNQERKQAAKALKKAKEIEKSKSYNRVPILRGYKYVEIKENDK